ncbi:AI-2E family transporter [Palleronia sediminis]|uniref:AI-2E family transporter n=1 Tax=Palleronia sediminis TaxID=2547833 RepID=A0A4R6AAY9_9RHOB|nr:AI-2E family transporter [Palleronia sediminis]TDL81101.1 AI-2E family transporter [Palleronia sediminis]
MNMPAFRTAMAVIGIAILFLAAHELVVVLLLVFAAILLAVFLRNLGVFVARHTPLSPNVGVGVVCLLLIALVSGFFWSEGPRMADRLSKVIELLPGAVAEVRSAINATEWGAYVFDNSPELSDSTDFSVTGALGGTLSRAVGVIANTIVVLSVGIYLALDPRLYHRGALQLVPVRHRERAADVLESIGTGLWKWLIGQIFDMIAVGVMIGAGLWLLDIPLAIALGVIAGLTNFIPILGPFLGGAPAVLLAFTQSPMDAVYVTILIVVVQQIDGQVLMPLIQQRATSLPPALTVLAVVVGGILFGFLGVLLATPMLIVILIAVRMIYVNDVLDGDARDGA